MPHLTPHYTLQNVQIKHISKVLQASQLKKEGKRQKIAFQALWRGEETSLPRQTSSAFLCRGRELSDAAEAILCHGRLASAKAEACLLRFFAQPEFQNSPENIQDCAESSLRYIRPYFHIIWKPNEEQNQTKIDCTKWNRSETYRTTRELFFLLLFVPSHIVFPSYL